ncbi:MULTISPECIES: chemotaxis protein CheW [Leptolyngbya]|uniref:chemotaxis protein CheW n=1 Tax=Leptolyngbya TaxID=47251 RepID=UPI001683CC84|nr:chemotaxis protein CheW [Leptolyngbya sp. FACHB-1624]MBD1859762.1 chemotaxis protein CheW [Leptolyngbya sp. FACHB-1624]
MTKLSEFTRTPIATASLTSLASLLSPPAGTEPMQKFLRFRLDRTQSMLLAVEGIAAVQTLAIADILPVPQMNACILGMSNWRGDSLWLVDLAQQLGVQTRLNRMQKLTALSTIVVQINDNTLGLVIPEIYEIEEYNPKMLLNPPADLQTNPFFPFIRGYFKHDRSLVLDAAAVVQDPSLQLHHFNS